MNIYVHIPTYQKNMEEVNLICLFSDNDQNFEIKLPSLTEPNLQPCNIKLNIISATLFDEFENPTITVNPSKDDFIANGESNQVVLAGSQNAAMFQPISSSGALPFESVGFPNVWQFVYASKYSS